MKIKFLSAALGIVLSATVMSANAQKAYTEGVVTYKTNMRGQDVEIKEYFRADSNAATFQQARLPLKYYQMPITNHWQYWSMYL